MLTEYEFDNWCIQFNILDGILKVIEQIRSSEPLRRVGGGRRNVSGHYSSRKMGFTIQFESHTVELAAIELFYEYDSDVLEYWDQAFQFSLKFKSKNGRAVTSAHVPDFFVIRQNSVGFEEWKPEKTLEELAVDQPNRYLRGEDGRWHSPPASEYAQKLGCYYRLRSNAEIDRVKHRNIKYLKGYLDKNYVVNESVTAAVFSVVASNPGISFAQLRTEVKVASVDDINALIATSQVYVDLSAAPLMEQERVHIFRDQHTAETYALVVHSRTKKVTDSLQVIDVVVGSSILWDGKCFKITAIGETKIWLSGEGGMVGPTHAEFYNLIEFGEITSLQTQEPISISSSGWEHFVKASPQAMEAANRRYQAIEPYLCGQRPQEETISSRTIRDWKAKFLQAKEKYGCGLIGLIDDRQAKGNCIPRYSDRVWEFIDKMILEHYETFKQKSMWAVYQMLVNEWEKEGMIEPKRQGAGSREQGEKSLLAPLPFGFKPLDLSMEKID